MCQRRCGRTLPRTHRLRCCRSARCAPLAAFAEPGRPSTMRMRCRTCALRILDCDLVARDHVARAASAEDYFVTAPRLRQARIDGQPVCLHTESKDRFEPRARAFPQPWPDSVAIIGHERGRFPVAHSAIKFFSSRRIRFRSADRSSMIASLCSASARVSPQL